MCISLLLLDASANEEYQEEESYQEAEAEGFEQYPNQGKLYCIASYLGILPIPSFYFVFIKAFLIVNFGVS